MNDTSTHTLMEEAQTTSWMYDSAAMAETKSFLMAYTTVLVKVFAAEDKELLVEEAAGKDDAFCHGDDENTMLGSMVVTFLFIPFSLYCGVVFFVFGVECYQFFSVWNFVSRTRLQDASLESRRQHTSYTEDLQQEGVSPETEKRRKDIKQKLLISVYCQGTSENSCSKTNCAICLTDFVEKDSVASIRECSCCSRRKDSNESQATANGNNCQNPIQFHETCLTQWLEVSASCPYCRDEVLPPPKQEKQYHRGTLQLSESLELASLEVEHYFFNALTIFGGIVASYTGTC